MLENKMAAAGSDNLQHHHQAVAETKKKKKKKKKKNMLREPFHLLTVTLLSLLLPLSFLLLSRLSVANYLISLGADILITIPQPFSLVFSLFLYPNPTLLHALVSVISLATLIHGLTGWTSRPALLTPAKGQYLQPRLYAAWILLCTLQVCVGLGIEVSIAAGIESTNLGRGGGERSLLCRLVFFLGLHETMRHWSRTVVKPVVDDTVFGGATAERWAERVAVASSLGGLWWWGLRDEVEALVMVAEMKKELLVGVGVADFMGWWLYYLTVTIGMVKVVKVLMWLGMVLLCRRRRRVEYNNDDSCEDEEKV